MSRLASFAAALLDPRRPVPDGLRAWNGSDVSTRLAVYRNNVIAGLIDALGDTYPVVRALVGPAFFAAMADSYLHGELPRSAVLAEYGAGFAQYVERFEPAAGLLYLADVARLEYAFVQAYHAPDARPLAPAALQALVSQPERLPGLCLRLLPSARLVGSRFPIVSIWEAHRGGRRTADVDPDQAESALVVRPELEVLVVPVTAVDVAFARRLEAGDSLGEAAAATMQEHPAFDLATALTRLLGARALLIDQT